MFPFLNFQKPTPPPSPKQHIKSHPFYRKHPIATQAARATPKKRTTATRTAIAAVTFPQSERSQAQADEHERQEPLEERQAQEVPQALQGAADGRTGSEQRIERGSALPSAAAGTPFLAPTIDLLLFQTRSPLSGCGWMDCWLGLLGCWLRNFYTNKIPENHFCFIYLKETVPRLTLVPDPFPFYLSIGLIY